MMNGADVTGTQPQSWWGGFKQGASDLFSNRDFLQLLAGMGARLGGEGSVAEAIGVPTQAMIQAQATREALEKQEEELKDYRKQILSLLGAPNDKSQPGINTITESADGIKVDIAKPPVEAPGPTESGTRQKLPYGNYPNISSFIPFA